jgi:hypothetical protein
MKGSNYCAWTRGEDHVQPVAVFGNQVPSLVLPRMNDLAKQIAAEIKRVLGEIEEKKRLIKPA